MGTPRVKYSCTACHRRKIKCNKIIPCENCVKRGIANLCSREEQGDDRALTNDAVTQSETNDLVSALLNRVAALEKQAGHAQSAAPGASCVPVNDFLAHQQVEHSAHNNSGHSTPSESENERPQHNEHAGSVSVLEFLAWGRRKHRNLHDAADIDEGPAGSEPNDEVLAATSPLGRGSSLLDSAHTMQLELLQTLLPAKDLVYRMVKWHAKCLLWYHGSFNSVVFRNHLDVFYSRYRGDICAQNVNTQWVALLFAILTGSMTCSSSQVAASWGFRSNDERAKLSYHWYQATVTCLNIGNYLEVHKMHSVQAISTLTISAHTIGLSNSQSVLLASANRIAQSLGLNHLKVEVDSTVPTSDQELSTRTFRETGRRVWTALCTQDWFSIPFSESYSLNPDDFDTGQPMNCNEDDPRCLPVHTPTITSYCNYHCDIAALMPSLQSAIASSNTLFTKYERTLEYDEKMRQLVTKCMPTFLSPQSSVPPDWPVYVPWARRGLAVCAAHKIMMIHRHFIWMSFTNSAFALTRKTCIAASKTILKEVRSASDENGPILWIEQAFVVAAGIVLSLDALHRNGDDPQRAEHERLLREAKEYLASFKLSMIATRGIRLLSFLEQEISTSVRNPRKRRHPHEDGQQGRVKTPRPVDMPSLLRKMSKNLSSDVPPANHAASPDENLPDIFADMFPPQTGFTFFEWEYPTDV